MAAIQRGKDTKIGSVASSLHTRQLIEESMMIHRDRVFTGVEDMVLLTNVDDKGISDNLSERLRTGEIYTYIGAVLVVCNPYQWLPLYGNDTVGQYPFRQQGSVAPHIFYTAESAYRGMIQEELNQCIIVSGESGAGKTETSKQIQTYIAAVCAGDDRVDRLKEVFLKSNPVLESFGNAKTLQNNNSSRFGKYFELKFNKLGHPKGGVITNYVLEKSRIVRPKPGERGFHIFYQLLASDYKHTLNLSGPSRYAYLNCSNCYTVDGVNDSKDFITLLAALRAVGVTEIEVESIMNVVAGILVLGNINFQTAEGLGNQEGSKIADGTGKSVDPASGSRGRTGSSIDKKTLPDLKQFKYLLMVDEELVNKVLTTKEIRTKENGRMQSAYVSMNPTQAADRRDSLARSLYEKLFDYIVHLINHQLITPNRESSKNEKLLSIGVLDIYGFEIFQNNGFEQLCINYVNEKLQQIFIELTLRTEQDEYAREGIQWTSIPFFNNRIVCELLDGSNPAGLFRILDDVCKTNQALKNTAELDNKMLRAAVQIHSAHPHFSSKEKTFIIKHYAGDVEYQLGSFGETNKDSLGNDLIDLMRTSGLEVVREGMYGGMSDESKAQTAGGRLRFQCNALVEALMHCQPHYVRCIKSNDQRRALYPDPSRMLHQVKYLGLAENIKVRRAGFAFRCEYKRFFDRYYILTKITSRKWRGAHVDGCKAIMKAVSEIIPTIVSNPNEVQYGRSIIFIKHPETYNALNILRKDRISRIPVVIQRAWRTYLRKILLKTLSGRIGELYRVNKKIRNRNSMTRMFHASYLGVLGHPRSDTVKEAMFRIIDKYSTSENVKFIDPSCYQIVKSSHSPYWIKEARLLVLTDQAIYVMEILDDTMKAKISDKKSNLIPDVILRRRVSLLNIDPTTGEFESIHFSTLADGLMGIMMKPVPRINDPESIPHPNWPNKENVKNCMKTGKAFSMLLWKHRCNASGDIVINDVSELTQCIPDYGYYKPTRVSDDYFGIRSCDQIEDFLLVCDKKTEFLGLLLVEWDRLYGHKDIVYFHKDNTISLRKPVNELTSSQVVSEVYLEMDTSEVNDSNLYGMITSGYIEEYTIWNVLTMKVSHGEVSSGDSLPSYVNDYRKAASRQ